MYVYNRLLYTYILRLHKAKVQWSSIYIRVLRVPHVLQVWDFKNSDIIGIP